MPLEVLKPIRVKPERIITEQCCVEVNSPSHDLEWRKKFYSRRHSRFDYRRCQRESVVVIDGQSYCQLHGGKIALEKWLNGELVQVPKKASKCPK